MTSGLPAQDLQCPDPGRCPVAVSQLTALAADRALALTSSPTSQHWYRVYDARDGYGVPNPGYGDTRFAPFDSARSGIRVPTLYLAQTLEAALLETSLHNVHELQPREVAESSLAGKLHARVIPPEALRLVDLRDPQLKTWGLERENISSSSAEHYPCTRRVARAIHASPDAPAGIVWHSRQAELNGEAAAEVVVIFADRVPHARGDWRLPLARNASGALLEGHGRLLLDELAESLQVTIVTAEEF